MENVNVPEFDRAAFAARLEEELRPVRKHGIARACSS